MSTKLVVIILDLLLMALVVELVRKEKLSFKYAAGWILLGLLGLVLVVFDHLVAVASNFLGFQLPSNFIFFAAFCGLIFHNLQLTIFLCQQNDRNDKIAQKLGLLEHEIEEMNKRREA